MPTGDYQALPLTSLLAARITHDLAGLVGTIAGMLDLAVEGGDAEALGLAREAAQGLNARLRFLRAAWAGGGGEIGADGLLASLPGLPGAERLALDVSAIQGVLPEALGRVGLCLLLVGAESLRRGGRIRMTQPAAGSLRIELDGAGGDWPADIATGTQADWCEFDARGLAPPLSRMLAGQLGFALLRVSAAVLEIRPFTKSSG